MVFTLGDATGFEITELLSPVVGLQEYVVPPVAVNVVFPPEQIVTSMPAFAMGVGLTVTVTFEVAEHPFDVPVTV